jgi:hypothetical protein
MCNEREAKRVESRNGRCGGGGEEEGRKAKREENSSPSRTTTLRREGQHRRRKPGATRSAGAVSGRKKVSIGEKRR